MLYEVFQKEKIYKIIVFFSIIFAFISCKKEDIQLPKSNKTILNNIQDHSPVYMFFRVKEKDTTVDINRQNTISTTNWVFNIDKRLPLKLVIPEVMKLQEKKKNSSHTKEGAINVYSYADSIGKNLAFLPFTNVVYKYDREFSKFYIIDNSKVYLSFQNFSVNFNKENKITVDGNDLDREEFVAFIKDYVPFVSQGRTALLHLNFEVNLTYEQYIQNKIMLNDVVSDSIAFSPIEFIYDTNKLPECGCKL
jgi:biopolymer transport protein ExbD